MENNKIVIGIIGEKGSGKGTASDYLIKNHQADHFCISDILKRTLENIHIPPTRENYNKLAVSMKKTFKETVLIDALIEDIERDKANVVIADGIRMDGDVEPFREKYGENFYLLYVTADVKIRYERTKKRKEKAGEDKTTLKQFKKEEKNPTERDIPKIGKEADFTLNNNGTKEKLEAQVKEIAKKIFK